jgi:hypothetical protein
VRPREFWIYETGFSAGEGYSEYAVTDSFPIEDIEKHIHVREILSPDPRDEALKIAVEALKSIVTRDDHPTWSQSEYAGSLLVTAKEAVDRISKMRVEK